ncbi:TPA: hypothetical protein ACPEZ1_004560 [Enterobacter hormaechei]
MGKVTLPALLGATVIGFVVFALTSFYYRSEYIPKRSVLIVPDAPISIEDGSNAFPVQTVIMNDPTLIDKFVGEGNINEENAFDYHKSNVLEPNYKHEISREGANKRGNSSRLTQSFHFFMFEPIFSPVNALNQPI